MSATSLPAFQDAVPFDQVRYNEQGLVPAIVQDYLDGTVLMMAWMNQESLKKTLETGDTWFWSRSRQEFWHKGATSGHLQKVQGHSLRLRQRRPAGDRRANWRYCLPYRGAQLLSPG
jgi:phosphoribosyl-ATP pyrophosphohydrolase/phosphoribosyl-AMP cyclohydrolase